METETEAEVIEGDKTEEAENNDVEMIAANEDGMCSQRHVWMTRSHLAESWLTCFHVSWSRTEHFFFCLFPIWIRFIEFSLSMFSSLVLLSVLLSPSYFYVYHLST